MKMRELDFQRVPAVARRLALDELKTRLSALETELAAERTKSADLLKQLAEVRAELEQSRGGVHLIETDFSRSSSADLSPDGAGLNVRLDRDQAENEPLRSSMTGGESVRLAEEISACRRVADKCVFIVGFARSNTTISLEILNCASNALILGEANFFLTNHRERFTEWYNNQHQEFGNQITKSSYAPDFLPGKPHSWWQWLESASEFYDCVGEKVALSDYHLTEVPPDAFRAFYEARFLASRYIFMLRNPIDVLLSSAKLLKISDDLRMARLCAAWLDFMHLWADFVRVFPQTMTIVCERFGEATVTELEAFTGLDLGDAQLLIRCGNKQTHPLTGKFPTLVRLKPDLEQLYADAVAAVDENHVLWQAERKRDHNADQASRTKSDSQFTHSLGEVWIRAKELRAGINKV